MGEATREEFVLLWGQPCPMPSRLLVCVNLVLLLCCGGALRAQLSMEQVHTLPDSSLTALLGQELSDSTRAFARHWESTYFVETAADSALQILGELRAGRSCWNNDQRATHDL